MIGAIIGDIVGSRFEFNNHRSTDFQLFHPDCSFTDDTICTVAVAEWLLRKRQSLLPPEIKLDKYAFADMEQQLLSKIMREWCRKYPNPAGGYGGRFERWIWDDNMRAYNSFGNGSAMRVSPVAWAFDNVQSVIHGATISAEISHNHPEGMKGAQAIAQAIFYLRKGSNKHEVIRFAKNVYGYNSVAACEYLKHLNGFDETCEGTIPVCLQCLQESTDFESAIRLAVSVGGDTDTIAAITGSLAEACYGVPLWMTKKAIEYIPKDMFSVIRDFVCTFRSNFSDIVGCDISDFETEIEID
jgi:ADP-ribosylglycohydrolase